jgi:hypothetical protein
MYSIYMYMHIYVLHIYMYAYAYICGYMHVSTKHPHTCTCMSRVWHTCTWHHICTYMCSCLLDSTCPLVCMHITLYMEITATCTDGTDASMYSVFPQVPRSSREEYQYICTYVHTVTHILQYIWGWLHMYIWASTDTLVYDTYGHAQ